mmetsp:Transcript_12469/g.39452  ORF Transcript_12469/g.39452 Transcript_12469/m.39452 type:complete len:129 (+) Transcript_12469:135-521(+)
MPAGASPQRARLEKLRDEAAASASAELDMRWKLAGALQKAADAAAHESALRAQQAGLTSIKADMEEKTGSALLAEEYRRLTDEAFQRAHEAEDRATEANLKAKKAWAEAEAASLSSSAPLPRDDKDEL